MKMISIVETVTVQGKWGGVGASGRWQENGKKRKEKSKRGKW